MDSNNCPYNGGLQVHCSTSKGKSSIIVICVLGALLTPVVILVIYATYLHCKGKLRSQSLVHDIEATNSTAQEASKSGLDKSTLDSYPVFVVGEGDREFDHHHGSQTCPICLLDYQPNEIIKTLPGCLHCFHADCVDQWLCIDATCPICRASPPPINHS